MLRQAIQVEIMIHNMQKKKNINNIVQKVKLVQLQVLY